MTFSDKINALARHILASWTTNRQKAKALRAERKLSRLVKRDNYYDGVQRNGNLVYTANDAQLTIQPDGTYTFWDGKSQVATTGNIQDENFKNAIAGTPTGRRVWEDVAERASKKDRISNLPTVAGYQKQYFEYPQLKRMTPGALIDISDAENAQNAATLVIGAANAMNSASIRQLRKELEAKKDVAK